MRVSRTDKRLVQISCRLRRPVRVHRVCVQCAAVHALAWFRGKKCRCAAERALAVSPAWLLLWSYPATPPLLIIIAICIVTAAASLVGVRTTPAAILTPAVAA